MTCCCVRSKRAVEQAEEGRVIVYCPTGIFASIFWRSSGTVMAEVAVSQCSFAAPPIEHCTTRESCISLEGTAGQAYLGPIVVVESTATVYSRGPLPGYLTVSDEYAVCRRQHRAVVKRPAMHASVVFRQSTIGQRHTRPHVVAYCSSYPGGRVGSEGAAAQYQGGTTVEYSSSSAPRGMVVREGAVDQCCHTICFVRQRTALKPIIAFEGAMVQSEAAVPSASHCTTPTISYVAAKRAAGQRCTAGQVEDCPAQTIRIVVFEIAVR